MKGKVVPLRTAAESIPDGCNLGLCGFAVNRNAIALAHELIRLGRRNLTVSQCVAGMDTDLLVGAGVVSRLIYSTGSLDRFGPIASINRAISEGIITAEEYSGLSITFRYLAGSLGITYIPCNSLIGSDILTNLLAQTPDQVKEWVCPFTGEKQVLLRALQPEVGVIVANYSDTDGNASVAGPLWDLREMANASRRVIIFAEKIVPNEYVRNHPEQTTIPGAIVDMVVEVPWAAYPTAVYKCYDYDGDHLRLYCSSTRTPEGHREYLDKYVLGTKDHWEYLEIIGVRTLQERVADPHMGY